MEISAEVKRSRTSFLRNWPKTEQFSCEIDFARRYENMNGTPVFYPVLFKDSVDNQVHTVISYVIEALDCLPYKPDNAFDWFWKAFEYCLSANNNNSITVNLQNTVFDLLSTPDPRITDGAQSLIKLAKEIPFQSCEYLFKKIATDGDFTPEVTGKIGKRTLYKNGNAPVILPELQKLFNHLKSNFSTNDHLQVRDAASLLRKAIWQREIDLDCEKIKLSDQDIHALLVCALTYTFRNDRTHAELFAPFRSSTATLTTYAHCWFMTLLAHCLLLTIVEYSVPDSEVDFLIKDNTDLNIEAFRKLFGDYRNK
ncbi:hypothetical protein [Enterovibrio coralii]|uniref:Uncharacterized protein n=1 Tax=Enterovibrio coralii TaxID=294935 RepID=A0A135IBR6_9GAMM|nr:hypothetical protein [Enterovibrio coralii]KXF82907.1 hypothetical protein ATN88_03840 [Enterovibrio coralii]